MQTARDTALMDRYIDTAAWPNVDTAAGHGASAYHVPAIGRAAERLLAGLAPISLDEMDAVALMDRVDTKYLLGAWQLPALLAALADDYRVLQVGGVRLSRYQTLYFDTPSLDLYARHQAGHAERFKVRSRCYVDSGLSFFEIKRKTNKGRTVKSRLQTATFWNRPTSEARRYLGDLGLALEELEPILANQFTRITLVGRQRPERVTIDLGLRFQAGRLHANLDGVIVVEIKQARIDRSSPSVAQMRALEVRPTAFSKYCIGVALLYPEVRHNRFKPVLNRLEQTMRENEHVERTGHLSVGRGAEPRRSRSDRALHLLPAYS
jgi:hypothetical protein